MKKMKIKFFLFKITLNKNKIYNNLNKFLNVKIIDKERERERANE